MNGLFERSINQKLPIEIIYLSEKGALTQRTIAVREIRGSYVKAYCFSKQQVRIFKMDNILSAGVKGKRVNYA